MAMAETATQPHAEQPGRLGRRRPFSALMKKLANLKATSSSEGGRHSSSKRNATKKPLNNPYPQSGRVAVASSPRHSQYSESSGPSRRMTSSSLERAESVRISNDGQPPPTTGGRSMAPTISTEQGTCRSIIAPSHGETSMTGTSRTANGRRGGDSTFSSPAPSVRSLTTTLTTIQTIAPTNGGNNNHTTTSQHLHNSNSQVIHFNQPFPTGSPASAIPAHLATNTQSTSSPTTYHTATANNLLTDNASILTLASSSKRRRRRSFDTDASVRALAPSSLWGAAAIGGPTTPGLHRGASTGMGGIGANERTSIYSATGIMGTTAASERNSFYAKQGYASGDGASVRSGLFGHGRSDSVAGSIGGGLAVPTSGTSPLASPREGVEEEEKEKEQEKEEVEREKN
ncbi:hypothetical protein B0I37DRAFT_391774 [Chaetomium sp. MPI-CAGE-AT-0009]|nr:hypothetical protein B0I37DRAFT_391774 [Chaetomium sp. MPI-CAGE-AT-0009]